ncbi:hypothetical protein [Nostoc sp. FACHB-145]|uniref:DUF7219 family protein n=1 Tax=Nostoc sp. FACHB-145 TaxID=2692836 RepID=UPI0028C3857B|nr:hypothetical protein [Nostoc sp. FACHB-145]
MLDHNQQNQDSLRYPLNHYHGNFNPKNLVFNANLQEFTQNVVYIVSLETSGKFFLKKLTIKFNNYGGK